MCSTPVTFGGGIMITNGFLAPSFFADGVKPPLASQRS
jgi:hypothetical protein